MCFVDMSSANCLRAFLSIVFRRGFLLGWQPCSPIWCRVRRMAWGLTGWLPTPSISAVMLTALLRRSFKESIWMWRSVHALSFFGRFTRGLFWVDLAILRRWMILATVLQLSFRVLAIFLSLWPSSCSATICLLRSSESYLPCGAMLELSVTSMRECESCTTNLNTPAPYAHMGLVTLMSHMTFWRENDKQYSIWIFRGVVS